MFSFVVFRFVTLNNLC